MASLDPALDKDGVRLTVDEAIATVTLTNPAKRNAQSPALWRALAEETGRSYGFVHRMLSESGVTLRGRGGATRGKKAQTA